MTMQAKMLIVAYWRECGLVDSDRDGQFYLNRSLIQRFMNAAQRRLRVRF